MNADSGFLFEPIGIIRTKHSKNYDVPRQPAYGRNSDEAALELFEKNNLVLGLKDLSGFSHMWILYVFHEARDWKPLVLPPAYKEKVGVFASRAPYRPNPVGMTAVEIVAMEGNTIRFRSPDMRDGTPVIDIKPYIPLHDSFPGASGGWLANMAENKISYAENAERKLEFISKNISPSFRSDVEYQLSKFAVPNHYNRIKKEGGNYILSYRYWRIRFEKRENKLKVTDIWHNLSEMEINELEHEKKDFFLRLKDTFN